MNPSDVSAYWEEGRENVYPCTDSNDHLCTSLAARRSFCPFSYNQIKTATKTNFWCPVPRNLHAVCSDIRASYTLLTIRSLILWRFLSIARFCASSLGAGEEWSLWDPASCRSRECDPSLGRGRARPQRLSSVGHNLKTNHSSPSPSWCCIQWDQTRTKPECY